MAWSIFTQGGGKPAAVQWAHDLLASLGAPQSAGNVQFIYDWETSEGGGGKYNPLNQGPVPGHPELTTTGSQYGGGAADFASYQAGIQGAVDYLNMSNYRAVKANLMADNAGGAKTALIESPWATSHYGAGNGKQGGFLTSDAGNHFATVPIPGGTNSIVGDVISGLSPITSINGIGQSIGSSGAVGNVTSFASDPAGSIVNALKSPLKALEKPFFAGAIRVGLVGFGAIAILVGVATMMKAGGSDGTVSDTVQAAGGKAREAGEGVSAA